MAEAMRGSPQRLSRDTAGSSKKPNSIASASGISMSLPKNSARITIEAISSPISRRRAGIRSASCITPGSIVDRARLSAPSQGVESPRPARSSRCFCTSGAAVSSSTGAPAWGSFGATAPKLTATEADALAGFEDSVGRSDINGLVCCY